MRFDIGDADLASYRRAADFLNVNQVDVLSVQHEWSASPRAALFDLETAERCLARGDSWSFGPETAYEREGEWVT